MLQEVANDDDYLTNLTFSDGATFHVSGHMNRCNCRVWGSENPCIIMGHDRAIAKLNVWYAIMYQRVTGPFFFVENTITSTSYLDMLEWYAIPQIHEPNPWATF
jgi:hypothetical protein